MSHYLLSHPLTPETPLYGNTPGVEFKPLKEMGRGDSSNSTLVSFCTHSGSHVDVPSHFSKAGKTLTDFHVSDFIFDHPVVIDCPKNVGELIVDDDLKNVEPCSDVDLVLLRTGFSQFRHSEIYRTNNPGVDPSFVERLRRIFPSLRALGVDCISVSPYQNRELGRATHRLLLAPPASQPILILEDLIIPKEITTLNRVFAVPIFFQDLDGSPITVIAEVFLPRFDSNVAEISPNQNTSL